MEVLKMKNSILRKVLATALSAVTLLCTGFTTSGQFVSTSVSVSASDTLTYGDFQYSINDDNTITIQYYIGNVRNIVIPSTIENKNVTKIGGFDACQGLESIIIPDTVTEISKYAFCNLTKLKNIKISNKLTVIGECAFQNCTALTSLTLPDSLKQIEDYSFYNCTGLTSIKIPNYVTSIGDLAFYNCTELVNINIPNSVNSIGTDAFFCTAWETNQPNGVIYAGKVAYKYKGYDSYIIIKNGTNSIGASAFYSNKYVENIDIPNSVTHIGNNAFFSCKVLKRITIPDSVVSIGEKTFFGCDNLTIYGIKNSYAETYAKENNIPFVSFNGYTNISTISTDEIVLGNTVTVNAKAVLGEGDYTYAVLYKKKTDTKWTVKQNYSTNDTITIKPAKATDYDVCVKVKDSTGKIVKKFFEVKVNAKLANTSTISATTIKKGNTVTLNGSATGGMGDYTYAALYKKKAETKWTTRQGYKDNSEILVRPYTNTDYDICIKVKDKDGTITKKYFTVTVTK